MDTSSMAGVWDQSKIRTLPLSSGQLEHSSHALLPNLHPKLNCSFNPVHQWPGRSIIDQIWKEMRTDPDDCCPSDCSSDRPQNNYLDYSTEHLVVLLAHDICSLSYKLIIDLGKGGCPA